VDQLHHLLIHAYRNSNAVCLVNVSQVNTNVILLLTVLVELTKISKHVVYRKVSRNKHLDRGKMTMMLHIILLSNKDATRQKIKRVLKQMLETILKVGWFICLCWRG